MTKSQFLQWEIKGSTRVNLKYVCQSYGNTMSNNRLQNRDGLISSEVT